MIIPSALVLFNQTDCRAAQLCADSICGVYAASLGVLSGEAGTSSQNSLYSGDGTWTWTENGIADVSGGSKCERVGTSYMNYGYECYCQITSIGGASCLGEWVYTIKYPRSFDCIDSCARQCAIGAEHGVNRGKLFNSIPDPNYVVSCTDSCPSNYIVAPDIATGVNVSASCSDSKGTFSVTCQ
jgi:hypothetical protein